MAATRVVGVDFSGARDAGRRTWIARGSATADGLRLEACFPATELPASAESLDRSLSALREFIAGLGGGTIVGCDFPFGLAAELADAASWDEFVAKFPSRYQSAAAFLAACQERTPDVEIRRRTDRETRTPFSSYSWRIYRQTYYGIRDILAPLVRDRRACVLPMQEADPDLPWLVEICPASTLKQLGLYRSYKLGAPSTVREQRRRARADILVAIVEAGLLVDLPPRLRDLAVADPGGDALDSILAAVAAFRAARDPSSLVAQRPEDRLEGRIYV